MEDDILGIWGDEKRTGKSAASDLAEGKLSLPVVYALAQRGAFAKLWHEAGSRARNTVRMRALLEEAGAHDYATKQAARLTNKALSLLTKLKPRGARRAQRWSSLR